MATYLKIDFTDIEGTDYQIAIRDETYTGDFIQVQGKAVLEYPKVKTMDMLRGSTLKIQLEASIDDTYQQRLIETVGDKKLEVILFKTGVTVWTGFIKPDGIVESFVTDYWIINIQAVDGLGYLENIKFLNAEGEPYQENVSELLLLARCLELTGQAMLFKVYDFNLFYTVDENSPITSNKALLTTYVNTNRYFKEDEENSVFTAKEVLESLLKKYGAYIVQQDNVWNIVRLEHYFSGLSGINFNLYELNGDFNSTDLIDHRTLLGSQIDGYFPHHADANQQKNYKASLGAYKVIYNYGLVKTILENSTVYFNSGDTTDIDGWTVADDSYVTMPGNYNDPTQLWPAGYWIKKLIAKKRVITGGVWNTDIIALTSDINSSSEVIEGDSLSVNIKVSVEQRAYILVQYVRVIYTSNSGQTLYLNNGGEWTPNDFLLQLFTNAQDQGVYTTYDFQATITSNPIPEDGNVQVQFMRPIYYNVPESTSNFNYVEIKEVNVTGSKDTGLKGESHTSTRIENATAIVETADNIYVGDNNSDIYIGGIENSDGLNSLRWSKASAGIVNQEKQYKLLRWLVEDRLQISSGNATMFKGGVYGYLPYLGALTIKNVDGLFITAHWSYDLVNNKISAEFERIFQDDISDETVYSFSYETDNVVRPAIE